MRMMKAALPFIVGLFLLPHFSAESQSPLRTLVDLSEFAGRPLTAVDTWEFGT